MMNEHQLSMYEAAAVQAVYALGGDPYRYEQGPDGQQRPAWVAVAWRMCEMRTMLDLMRQHGLL